MALLKKAILIRKQNTKPNMLTISHGKNLVVKRDVYPKKPNFLSMVCYWHKQLLIGQLTDDAPPNKPVTFLLFWFVIYLRLPQDLNVNS